MDASSTWQGAGGGGAGGDGGPDLIFHNILGVNRRFIGLVSVSKKPLILLVLSPFQWILGY
jgi:hypothetical protein